MNVIKQAAFAVGVDVLIDTWGNVNVFTEMLFDAATLVLIDTWWNVN